MPSPADILSIVARLSPVLGGAAKGRGDAQTANDTLNLQRSNLQLGAPQRRLNAATRASLLKNAQPIHATAGPSLYKNAPAGSTGISFPGGLNSPGAISPDVKSLSDRVMKDELMNQMTGGDIPKVGQTGTLDRVLGGAGLVSSLLGGAMGGDKGTMDLSGAGGWLQRAMGGSTPFDPPGGSSVTGNARPDEYGGIDPNTGSPFQFPDLQVEHGGSGLDNIGTSVDPSQFGPTGGGGAASADEQLRQQQDAEEQQKRNPYTPTTGAPDDQEGWY